MTKTQKKRTNPFFEFLAKYRAEHPNETGPKLAKNAGIAYRAAKKKGKLGHRQHGGGSCDEGDTDCSQSGFELLKGGRRKKSKKNRRAGMRGGDGPETETGADMSADAEPVDADMSAETEMSDADMSAETGSVDAADMSDETGSAEPAETETPDETGDEPFTGGRRSRKHRKRAKKGAKKSAKKSAKKGAKKGAKKSKKNRKKGGRH